MRAVIRAKREFSECPIALDRTIVLKYVNGGDCSHHRIT